MKLAKSSPWGKTRAVLEYSLTKLHAILIPFQLPEARAGPLSGKRGSRGQNLGNILLFSMSTSHPPNAAGHTDAGDQADRRQADEGEAGQQRVVAGVARRAGGHRVQREAVHQPQQRVHRPHHLRPSGRLTLLDLCNFSAALHSFGSVLLAGVYLDQIIIQGRGFKG